MNDTDAVVADGLFPVLDARAVPHLALEEVQTQMGIQRKGFEKTVVYTIINQGNATQARVGYALDELAGGGRYGPYGVLGDRLPTVEVDSRRAATRLRTGRLVDLGERVLIQPRTQAEIDTCNAHNDGDICGHHWLELDVTFGPGQRRKISIRKFYRWPDNASYAPDAIAQELVTYAEKFWAGPKVIRIEALVRTGGIGLTPAQLIPGAGDSRQRYDEAPSRPQVTRSATYMRWTLHDYRPARKPQEFGIRLVDPRSIDGALLSTKIRSQGSGRRD